MITINPPPKLKDPRWSPALVHFLSRCMEPKPEKRASAEQLLVSLSLRFPRFKGLFVCIIVISVLSQCCVVHWNALIFFYRNLQYH